MKHKDNGEHSPWKQKRTGGSKEDGVHSEHHAQTDARKEKRNGGHFLEKQKRGSRTVPRWKGNAKGMKTLSREGKEESNTVPRWE